MGLKKNEKVELKVKGDLTESITKVSMDGIPVVNKKFDLCTEVAKINITCPIPAQTKTLTYNAPLPSVLPVGKIKAEASAYDAAGNELFCVKGGADIPPVPEN